MKHSAGTIGRAPRGHRVLRWCTIALATLVLCSCQATTQPAANLPNELGPAAQAMPAPAYAAAMLPCPAPQPLPIPLDPRLTACSGDELVCDGGDHGPGVMVAPDWRLSGLGPQDTVAHYDTIDGRTLVTASNCVCLYAPRFGAVRSVTRIAASEQIDMPTGVVQPERAVPHQDVKIAASSLQREQPRGEIGAKLPEGFTARQNGAPISSVLMPLGFQEGFLPYENFLLVREGRFDNGEKARLSQAIEAAIAWTLDQAVQVTLNGQPAVAATGDRRAQTTYQVKDLRNCPKLRVFKVASAQTARSGDTVDFTLRFDNIGDQPLGNIVLVDHLVPRLQFVPGSAQSSVKANFSTSSADGDALVLRWEIAEPIEPNQGGLVRFRCKVR